MCRKFSANTSLNDLWTSLPIPMSNLSTFPISYTVQSGDLTPILHQGNEGLEVTFMKWGLIPPLHSLENTISFMTADIEKVNHASFFRNLITQKRCLIPISGYYEADQKIYPQQSYYFYLPYRELFTLAGLWNLTTFQGKKIYTFCILTKKADFNVEPIHNRMPVIVTPADHYQWLENEEFDVNRFFVAPPLYYYKVTPEGLNTEKYKGTLLKGMP